MFSSVFPTNTNKKRCFWNFVGFSKSGVLCLYKLILRCKKGRTYVFNKKKIWMEDIPER